jgi:hypothetical protein
MAALVRAFKRSIWSEKARSESLKEAPTKQKLQTTCNKKACFGPIWAEPMTEIPQDRLSFQTTRYKSLVFSAF